MAAERDPLVPHVPTFEEKGYDIAYGGFRVLAAPAGTPEPIRSELERVLLAACVETTRFERGRIEPSSVRTSRTEPKRKPIWKQPPRKSRR